ncbi:MAG: ATP synthase F1 subunit epsilon [Lachnospiraceae bacterium]
MADENRFVIRIITPDRVFYEGKAEMVEFNTVEGEVGIYKNHIPMTMIIKPGILCITDGEEEKIAALHAGFVEVLPDKITILAEIIEWPDEIDVERAEAAKERAEKRLREKNPKTDMVRAEAALQRSIARISVIR